MMINLKMPDSLFEHYVKQWGVPGLYPKLVQAIELCKDIEKSDRALLLTGDARRAVEAVFQTTLDTPEKLVKLVQNLSRVSIGGVDMAFTSDELERLKMQATFHGRTLEVYIKETVQELRGMMLERV